MTFVLDMFASAPSMVLWTSGSSKLSLDWWRRRLALRSVLTAALIALSDEESGAADLHLQARKLGNDAELSLLRLPADRAADNSPTGDYRQLNWRDVQALAQAEAVGFSRSVDSVHLIFTSAVPAVASVP